jgi:hypothetical protein
MTGTRWFIETHLLDHKNTKKTIVAFAISLLKREVFGICIGICRDSTGTLRRLANFKEFKDI